MRIRDILKYEPRVNVLTLWAMCLSVGTFDCLLWLIEIFVDTGEISIIKLIAFIIISTISLTVFKIEFIRLNRGE